MKMVDFKNHRFSLRCLSKGIIPISVKLKSNVQTPKGNHIVKKAERALLSERVRLINNTTTMFKWQIDTCINQLKSRIDREAMEECNKFIKVKREARHLKTLERQKNKFERLCQRNTGGHSNTKHGGNGNGHSNINTSNVPSNEKQNNNKTTTTNVPPNQVQNNNDSNNWVRNLSKILLAQAQEQVLSHGPNFAIVAKEPPIGEYIAQVEKVCQQLKQGEAENQRGEIKSILKKIYPPKSNVTKEEAKAIQELKKDTDRIILTADKGVSMVVMDKEEYIKNSEELSSQSSCKVLPSDPTKKHKTS